MSHFCEGEGKYCEIALQNNSFAFRFICNLTASSNVSTTKLVEVC